MSLLFIALVAAAFVAAQAAVLAVDDVRDLWKGSALLGLAYGGLFGLFPRDGRAWGRVVVQAEFDGETDEAADETPECPSLSLW